MAGPILSDSALLKAVRKTEANVSDVENLGLVREGADSFLRREIQRDFSQQTLTDYLLDVEGANARHIFLPERPIRTFTALKRVTGRDPSTGLPDSYETVDRDVFAVDSERGCLKRYSGTWDEGFGIYAVTAVVGYTDAEIQGASGDFEELKTLRLLAATLTARQFALFRTGQQHLSGLSLGGENAQIIEPGLTLLERQLIRKLSGKRT